jgi:hypothetical protein
MIKYLMNIFQKPVLLTRISVSVALKATTKALELFRLANLVDCLTSATGYRRVRLAILHHTLVLCCHATKQFVPKLGM